jgi:hypothetical protein
MRHDFDVSIGLILMKKAVLKKSLFADSVILLALSEENQLLAQTQFWHLATIDFSRFFRIGPSDSGPL